MRAIHKTAMMAVIGAAVMVAAGRGAWAQADIDAKAKDVVKSVVVVEYTLRNENVSRQESGQGLLIEKDGVILVSGGTIPEAIPKEWIKDLKVRLPLKDFTSVPAKLLGRTPDRLFAFLKTEKPIDAPVFEPGEMAETKLGEDVFAVGMLGKAGGYATYVGVSQVKTIMDLTHILAGTGTFGLTAGMSPVFDSGNGKLVGITLPALGEGMVMRDSTGARRVELTDEEQSSVFLPESEIKDLFKDIPTEAFTVKHPWIAVDEISGLQEEVKSVNKIEQPSGVVVGSVIAGEAADKAGLKALDIILTVNGKEFSKSPVPELMVMHFSRLIEKCKPGDVLTLGVLRDEKKLDLKLTVGTQPKQSGEMPHVFSPKVGVVTRDLVFSDAYARHIPQDTKGVMVVLVKNGAPAALGSTPLRSGFLITKVDDQPVTNEEDFQGMMKKLEDAKETVFVVIQPNGETGVCRIDLTK